jgi:hypothetical protein
MNRQKKMEISLGDLIFALTEAVQRHIRDEKLVYEIVADLLAGMVAAQGKINFSGIFTEPARLASV